MATTFLTQFFQDTFPAWAAARAADCGAGGHPLEYPLEPTPRIYVLSRGIRREVNVIPLNDWRRQPVDMKRAQSLAGSFPQLREVGMAAAAGELALPQLAYPLTVITSVEEAPLGSAEHDELWRLFGLPVLEQIRTAEGRLLAFECEARQGYHTRNPEALASGFTFLPGPCPCGLHGPRVRAAATS